ncbi:hypothetical protein FFF34_001740 [Inquilinus sp. KBS0705]|nr:hypothetical protein FFF34_001740 [Inquilinus sp. KBS0705]
MKLIFNGITACLTALLFTLNANAQTVDYIINYKSDTVKCAIGKGFLAKNYSYKLTPDGKSVKISIDDVKEYYIAKDKILNRAVIREGKDKREYMQLIEGGKIDLYEKNTTTTYGSGPNQMINTTSNTLWYISKGSDTVKEVKNNEVSIFSLFNKSRKDRKSDFVEMIHDNKEVYDKYIADDKYSFKQVQRLVHYYNTGILL